MLGTTLWFVVVLGLIAGVLMDTAAAFGRASVHAAADHALEPALHDAVADYQNALAGASGVPPNTLERTLPPERAAAAGAPQFTLAYSIVPTTIAAPSCADPGTPAHAGVDTIAWLQCSGFVRESRLSLHVTARVLDAEGIALLAQREQYVTLRLFAEPPYSAIVGRKDGSTDARSAGDGAPAAHEGDAGGETIAGTAPAAPAGAWPAGGTLIHVRYECRDGAGSCANAAPPDPDADVRAGVRWTNGNQPVP